MTAVFLKLLNMSIAANWLVLAVLLLRLLFRKSPGWFACLLWGLVALRLVMPITLESPLSLIPSSEVIPANVTISETPAIYSGIPAVNSAVNPLFTQYNIPETNHLEIILKYATLVWLAGTTVMLLYGLVNYWKLRRQVRASIPYGQRIYICDDVDSPFLLGVFRPGIYLPSGMEPQQMQYVLAHETAHLQRRDHWWKPLSFLLLSVYWFNPLLWIGYLLFCRDVERACDQKVIAKLDPQGVIGYSMTLTACSIRRRTVMICPVAFGEVSIKARIKRILTYKKPTLWFICISGLLCAITAVCFLTNPEPCSHLYQGEITIEPTCTETGISTRVCSHCQHSYTVRLELAAHTYNSGQVTKASTCTHTGSQLLECTVCGNQKTELLKKTAHTAAGTVCLQEANCTEAGTLGILCSCCNEIFTTQPLPKNDVHDLHETVLLAPTCLNPGRGVIACSRCDWQQECTYEATGHTFAEKHRMESDCIYDGIIYMECIHCQYSYHITIPKKQHVWKQRGSDYLVCAECGFSKSKNFPFSYESQFSPGS